MGESIGIRSEEILRRIESPKATEEGRSFLIDSFDLIGSPRNFKKLDQTAIQLLAKILDISSPISRMSLLPDFWQKYDFINVIFWHSQRLVVRCRSKRDGSLVAIKFAFPDKNRSN